MGIKYTYNIPYPPVPWTAHKGYGKKSFNPKYKEKEAASWQVKLQHDHRPIINAPVRIDLQFEMPIPDSMPKRLQKRIDAGEKIFHDKRPDRDNMQKFCIDCLIGTVIKDDNIVVCGYSEKYYSRSPRTIITVEEICP